MSRHYLLAPLEGAQLYRSSLCPHIRYLIISYHDCQVRTRKKEGRLFDLEQAALQHKKRSELVATSCATRNRLNVIKIRSVTQAQQKDAARETPD